MKRGRRVWEAVRMPMVLIGVKDIFRVFTSWKP